VVDEPFRPLLYRFTPGIRAGETVSITDEQGKPLLTYRSFASVVGIVAALVAGIVIIAGIAAMFFLIAEERQAAAATAAILAVSFAVLIATLVPRSRVTLYDGNKPALSISERSRFPFPATVYAVKGSDGTVIALLQRSAIARFGRNRWSIASPPDQRGVAFAVEESFGRAMARKFLGKFRRSLECNMMIVNHGTHAGAIIRRPDARGLYDVLEIAPSASLDRRVLVALATLVFGSEP
jgi:hypothetical protein